MLTHKRLLEVLRYNRTTGVFVRRKAGPNNVHKGDVAGRTDSNGHIQIGIDNRKYMAHVLAFFYVTGEWPKHRIDHRNCKPGDNRWRNLRAATNSQNGANSRLKSSNTSGFKGVTWHKGTKVWHARIRVDRKLRFIGSFRCPREAHAAYRKVAKEEFGEFARFR